MFRRKREFVLGLSRKVEKKLKPFCKRMKIVGSIRRKSINPRDIDLVIIPEDRLKLEKKLKEIGAKFVQGGEKKSRWMLEGIKVELYYSSFENWGAMLLAYSSKKGAAIGLRIFARMKGFKLNQYGLFRKAKRVAGKTEKEIYHALGRPYKEPWNR